MYSRRILITGGASSLGEAITRSLVRSSDNRVFFTYNRSLEAATRIEHEFPQAKALHCDFTDPESLHLLLMQIPDLGLDVLINNAWTGLITKHFHKTEPAAFQTSFVHNVLPTVQITQQAILAFRKKKSGKIINVLTSYLINRPPTGLAEYVANKAYLASMSKSWCVENARHNITSCCVSPSLMQTQLTSDVDERVIAEMIEAHPLKALITPQEVADTIEFLVRASPHINGANIIMNGGADVI